MFSGKKVVAKVIKPIIVEEKGFLSSNQHLQFDIVLQGEVSSIIQRRDTDFNEIHKYLIIKYPNALVPFIDPSQSLKKNNDEYMKNRPLYLTRFLNYSLGSE